MIQLSSIHNLYNRRRIFHFLIPLVAGLSLVLWSCSNSSDPNENGNDDIGDSTSSEFTSGPTTKSSSELATGSADDS